MSTNVRAFAGQSSAQGLDGRKVGGQSLLRRRQFLDFSDVDRRQQLIACGEMAVERAGADLRALRNFVHAGVGAAAGKNLPGNLKDALAVTLCVGTRLADDFGGDCFFFHGNFSETGGALR